MAQTKIKAGLFEGIIGNGTDGYFLMSNGDGTMTWSAVITNPTITSIDYPGTATAADPAGGETITVTGTGFKTGAAVTVGGTSAPSVSYVSDTQITFTTPAKTAGDYDIVVANTDTGSATFINGISFNGIPSWTTAAGSLGTFASSTTISTITLQATEPDAGTITFNITNGALPTGLSLTGANIDGTTSLETADTLYTFTVTATDDENQATPRTFTITVQKQVIPSENFTINTYTGTGTTQNIEGKIGRAADFNGSSSYISSVANIGYGNSVSMWFNLNLVTNTSYPLFGRENGGGLTWGGVSLYYDGTDYNLNMQLRNTSYLYQAYQNFNLSAGWHHIVFTFDSNSGYTAYIDNSEVTLTTTISSGTVTFPTGTSSIGRIYGNNDPAYYFNGKIDQVRIFNKKLSASEVSTLYNESSASSTKSTADIFGDSSAIALYEFEDGAVDTAGTQNGTLNNVNFVGSAFQPDLVVSKSRSTAEPAMWIDSVRGGSTTRLFSDRTTISSVYSPDSISSFSSNGFTAAGGARINGTSNNYIAWCWKGGGSAVSNTDGTITSSVSANQEAGFSIVQWTTNFAAGDYGTVGHGLSSAPNFIITKNYSGAYNWWTSIEGITGTQDQYVALNTIDAAASQYANFGRPTSTTFTDSATFRGGGTQNSIAYCFHSVSGHQKFGTYTGTGSGGNSITGLGFSPRFVTVKSISAAGGWITHSKPPTTTNPSANHLRFYLANAEDSGTNERINFDSDGFTLNAAGGNVNGSSITYLYWAIA